MAAAYIEIRKKCEHPLTVRIAESAALPPVTRKDLSEYWMRFVRQKNTLSFADILYAVNTSMRAYIYI